MSNEAYLEAPKDVKPIKSDSSNAGTEINSARDQFTSPADYNNYLTTFATRSDSGADSAFARRVGPEVPAASILDDGSLSFGFSSDMPTDRPDDGDQFDDTEEPWKWENMPTLGQRLGKQN